MQNQVEFNFFFYLLLVLSNMIILHGFMNTLILSLSVSNKAIVITRSLLS